MCEPVWSGGRAGRRVKEGYEDVDKSIERSERMQGNCLCKSWL